MPSLSSKIIDRVFPIRPNLTKLGQMKYRVVKEATGFALVLVLVAVGSFLFDYWAGIMIDDRNKLRNKINRINGEVSALEGKLTKAEKSLPVYRALVARSPGGEIPLDRRQAGETLDKIKGDYGLSSLNLALPPVRDMEGAKYKNPSVSGVLCEMGLTVEGPSDEHIFRFLSQVKRDIPGMFKITAMTLTRAGEATPQALKALERDGKSALTKATMRLQWMGMKAVPKNTSPDSGKEH